MHEESNKNQFRVGQEYAQLKEGQLLKMLKLTT